MILKDDILYKKYIIEDEKTGNLIFESSDIKEVKKEFRLLRNQIIENQNSILKSISLYQIVPIPSINSITKNWIRTFKI